MQNSSIEDIKTGDFVKISRGGERFWVTLNNIVDDVCSGIIDNDLVNTTDHGLNFGDKVHFPRNHILDVMKVAS